MSGFFKTYFDGYGETLGKFIADKKNRTHLDRASGILKRTRNTGRMIYLIGNGGSAAIAEHMAIDLTKNAHLRAMSISGSPQLTALANDCGYGRIYARALEAYARKGDVLIAISSSGTSPSIINAALCAKRIGCKVITFSGFRETNPLRKMGHVNIHVSSNAYGYVEIMHNLLIHYLNDSIIGSAVYRIK